MDDGQNPGSLSCRDWQSQWSELCCLESELNRVELWVMATVPTGSSLAELRSDSPPDYILRLFPVKALAALPSEPIVPF